MKLSIIFTFILALAFNTVYAQFEGTMNLTRITTIDTTYYKYYVKDNKIRIDELNSETNEVEGTMIVDIKEEKVYALSPQRKLFYEVNLTPDKEVNKNDFEISKKKNKKTIAGYVCEQWIVKNKTDNTVISYWVVLEGFEFFKKYMLVLPRKEKIRTYFLQIDDIIGVIPFMTVERSMLREFVSSLEITSVDKKSLDDSYFKVPNDYQEFKK